MWLNPGWSLMKCECVRVCLCVHTPFSIVILIEFIHWMERPYSSIISSFAKHIWFHHHHRRVVVNVVIAVLRWLFLMCTDSVCMVAYYLIWVMWLWYKNTITWNWLPHFRRTSRVVLYSNIKKKVLLQITHTDTDTNIYAV